jgi:hypothetical protein
VFEQFERLLWEATNVPERYVTTSEAAKAVDVPASSLRRWAARGIVTAARVSGGGHYQWDVEDLRRQLAELGKRP